MASTTDFPVGCIKFEEHASPQFSFSKPLLGSMSQGSTSAELYHDAGNTMPGCSGDTDITITVDLFSGFKVLGCSDAFIKTFGEVTLYARLQQFVDPQAWQPFTRWLALCSIALLSPVSTRKCWNALNMLTCLDKGQPMHAQFKCIFRHDGVVRHYSPDPKLRSLEVMPLQLHLIQEMGERSTRSLISL